MTETIRPAQMRELEQQFMAEYNVPSSLLMEHAAQGIVKEIAQFAKPDARVLFLCGKGNNGGDGYAAARLWQAGGGSAYCVSCGENRGDAAMNQTLARQSGVRFVPAETDFSGFGLLVDALFGTGLTRAPEGQYAELIRRTNASGLPVVSVDVPSGLDADTGTAPGEAIRAAATVTFHRIKQGLLLRNGPEYTGNVVLHPILIPGDYGSFPGMRILSPEEPSLLPKRPVNAHKGTMGKIVILAGSPGMAGAAAFCAGAALQAGAGLVRILCRKELLPVLQTLVPNATCTVLPDDPDAAAALAERMLAQSDAAAVGCGLGTDESALPLLKVFRAAACPVVWDADALNMAAVHRELLPLQEKDVITPHPGEAARLMRKSIAEIAEQPLDALNELQAICGCAVVLKGSRTLIRCGDKTAIDMSGTPALAKGGSGDVLAGILTAMLGRTDFGTNMLGKLQEGVRKHGEAGRKAGEKYGENAVNAPRIIDML